MPILQDIEGEVIDGNNPRWGWEQNISLHDIISPVSMNRIECNDHIRLDGVPLPGKVDHAYCPLCSYMAAHH